MEFKAYEWSNEIERKNAEFTFAILRCFDCDRQNKIEKAYFEPKNHQSTYTAEIANHVISS